MFFYSDEDLADAGISRSQQWPAVNALLERHGLLQTKKISRRGPSALVQALRYSVKEVEEAEGTPDAATPAALLWRGIHELDETLGEG